MDPTMMRNQKAAQKVIKALESRQFEACWCETKEDALKTALGWLDKDMVIGYGGSATIDAVGLKEHLRENGYQLIDRDNAASHEEKNEMYLRALTADTFLTGCNAITEEGELVNVDGNGNRVAPICYGPKQVIVIVSINKLARNAEEALIRARTVAAPINAGRFGVDTPCVKTGFCKDCKSPDCICSQIVTTRFCKPAKRIKVILVGETLGF